jgi:hypothetical protein
MPSTITVQSTITWSLSFLEQQPVLINGLEPAIGSANLVLQTILGPPFTWPWNRRILTFSSSDQDSQQSGLSDFGFLEGGTVQPTAGGKAFELSVKQMLHVDASQARPQYCAPFLDDGAGNITFRFTPSPDQEYTAILPYQRRAPLIMSVAMTWAPVPDDKNYICQWGFLALMSLIGNDARFNEYNSKFMTTLLAAQGGLTDMERNIFLANWTRVMSQLQGTQLGTQERFRAREV